MTHLSARKIYRPSRRRERRLVDPDTQRVIRNVSLGILMLSLLLLAWSILHKKQVLPIRLVAVKGEYQHIDKALLQGTVKPFLKKGLVNLDSEGLKKALEVLPWVETVSLSRSLPNKLTITIKEHQPLARWNTQGLIDANGAIFDPGQLPPEPLPSLSGPEGLQSKMLDHYQQLNNQLSPLGLKIVDLYLSARHAWSLHLSNGIKIILGRTNPGERLQRFVSSYSNVIGARGSEVDYIDMRYTSGMAVRWK